MRKLLVSLLVVVFAGAAFANTAQVKSFADKLASKALSIAKDGAASKADKQKGLEALFETSVDIEWVARFVVGKHWRAASEQQRADYLANYKRFILKNYTSKLADYTGQDYKITSTRADGDGDYVLTMELINAGEPNVLLDYRIRKKGDEYKIFDIIVEGVSMITTQRSEFSAVISNKGLDFLIAALKKKAA